MKNFDLEWARERAGWNKSQAAQALGVNRVTFSEWESGRAKMPAHRFNAFLALTNVTLAEVAAATELLKQRAPTEPETLAVEKQAARTTHTPRYLTDAEQLVQSLRINGGWDEDGTVRNTTLINDKREDWRFPRVYDSEGGVVRVFYGVSCVKASDALKAVRRANILYGLRAAGKQKEYETHMKAFPHGYHIPCPRIESLIKAGLAAQSDMNLAHDDPRSFWNTTEGQRLEAERIAFRTAANAKYEKEADTWLADNGIDVSPWWVKEEAAQLKQDCEDLI